MRRFVFALLLFVLSGLPSFAQEPENINRWTTAIDLQYLSTSGNSKGQHLGTKLVLERKWAEANFKSSFYGERHESTSIAYIAQVNEDGSTDLQISEDTQLTAENYKLENRYDQKLNEKTSWLVGYDFTRNQFAGLDARHEWGGGLIRNFVKRQAFTMNAGASGVWVHEEPILEDVDQSSDFGAGQIHWNWKWLFNPNVSLSQDAEWVAKLEDLSDWRIDFDAVLESRISKRMSGKLNLKWQYDHMPALLSVTLYDGDQAVGSLAVPSKKSDLALSFALSLKF